VRRKQLAELVDNRLILLGALFATMPAVADEAMPDADFLEYLGSWDGSDADWVALADEPEDEAQMKNPTGKTDKNLSGVSEESHEDRG